MTFALAIKYSNQGFDVIITGKEIIYSFSEFDQKDNSTWERILAFAKNWNDSHQSQFVQEEDLEITFSSIADAELQELLEILEQKDTEEQWSWLFFEVDEENDPFLKENIEKHDFIQILGDGYPDSFYLNAAEVLAPYRTCNVCHTEKAVLVDDLVYWKIDNEHSAYREEQLDVINASNGSLLVSKKNLKALEAEGAKGYELLPVLEKDMSISKELFQLKSKVAVVKLDNLDDPDSVCDRCGSIIKQRSLPFTIPEKYVKETFFFSRHKEGLWGIYLKKVLYEALKVKDLKSIYAYQGLMVK